MLKGGTLLPRVHLPEATIKAPNAEAQARERIGFCAQAQERKRRDLALAQGALEDLQLQISDLEGEIVDLQHEAGSALADLNLAIHPKTRVHGHPIQTPSGLVMQDPSGQFRGTSRAQLTIVEVQ